MGEMIFYGLEAAIGFSFWRGFRWAWLFALIENIGYLIVGFKYILFGPLQIAMSLDTSQPLSAEPYVQSLPGIITSMGLVVIQMYRLGPLSASNRPEL
jgi:hypothetical protein